MHTHSATTVSRSQLNDTTFTSLCCVLSVGCTVGVAGVEMTAVRSRFRPEFINHLGTNLVNSEHGCDVAFCMSACVYC